ncbi:MAG: SPFH domain-containing protein, partial [Sphingomicrobium sp.]
MVESNVVALTSSRERQASTMSGYLMLALLLLSIVVQIYGIVQLANDNPSLVALLAVIVAPIALLFIACGFYMLQPNQAAAITLFGDYKGTDRTTGLRWVLPWL